MKRVNTFMAMGSEVQESKEKKVEGREETVKGRKKKMLGRKRAEKEQQQESSKKQKVEKEKESDKVDEAKLKKLLVIKKDEDIAIDAIPLATKLSVIIDYKLHKEGMMGDLKVMFEPDLRSDVWRMLQGYRVTIWKLIDSSRVHFVRFDNLYIFMLVERRYPLTPITVTNMLNKKLQTDHQNEMCNQLLKLMVKQKKGLKRHYGFLEVTTAQVHNENYAKWIEGNLFDFETPLCEAYHEFNCLLKIDTGLFTYDIQNFKTYDEYKRELNDDNAKGAEKLWSENRVPYQLCDHICEPFRFKNGGTNWPTCTSDIDGFCNGGELPGMVRVGSVTYFQDHWWYDELADGILKDETLALKAKIEGSWG
ncbi:hypothetical protein Tco_0785553 [Tanacetum coccineum]